MKTLLLLLLPAFMLAQTSYSENDIDAAMGNRYETLIANVEPDHPLSMVQGFMQMGLRLAPGDFKHDKEAGTFTQHFTQQITTGNETPLALTYVAQTKPATGYQWGVIDSLSITGDWEYVVKFFANFWSRKVSLGDIKPGELATTRFLSDVATISYLGNNKGKIEVITAKDRS